MAENPYITKMELASAVGISATSIMRNIEYMRNKYLRRVGPDNGWLLGNHRIIWHYNKPNQVSRLAGACSV